MLQAGRGLAGIGLRIGKDNLRTLRTSITNVLFEQRICRHHNSWSLIPSKILHKLNLIYGNPHLLRISND
jgi:hypothetical protein